ncbi:MAG TPA: winged helix-turn-helix domain-containing protein [Azospirillaceae bacterium]|nr:winged helix-turn-helix domain-containing protein [Azospirillaceae bacterium]
MPDGSISLADVQDFTLGPFRVRPSLNQVLVAGRWERLEPRIMKVLVLLSRTPGRVVSREELMRACWGQVFVGEDALNRCVSRLRGFFREHGEAVLIETIPKVGYRLTLADWAEEISSPAPNPPAAPPPEAPAPAVPADAAPRRALMLRGALLMLALLAAVGLGALLLYRATGQTVTAQGGWEVLRVTPAVRELDMQLSPALSPDGEMLAYTSLTPPDRNSDLYLRRLDGSAPRRLTDHPDWEISPAFSPDGWRLAYLRTGPNRPCEIRVYDLPSGPDRLVRGCEAGTRTALAWSPDGRMLYYTHRDSVRSPSGLVRVPVDGGEPERVTQPTVLGMADAYAAFSPDGRRLAFLRLAGGGTADLFVMDMATGEQRQVTHDSAPQRGVAWDRTGEGLFFVSARAGDRNLWWVPASGGNPRRLSTSAQPLGRMTAAADRVAVEVENHQASIARLRTDGSAAPETLAPSNSIDRDPDVASDGTIVFASDRTMPSELWLLPPGGEPTKLTELRGGRIEAPRWSPDGTRIAFAMTRDGNADVYVVDRDGGRLRRLTEAPAVDMRPTWSADGASVLFSSDRGGDWRLWRIAVDGSGGPAEPVSDAGGYLGRVDGEWLYFLTRDKTGLWRRRLPDGEPEQVAANLAMDDWRTWAVRDGLLVRVDRQAPGGAALVAERIGQGPGVPLVRIRELYEFSGLSIAPGGQEIVFSRSVTEDVDIHLMDVKPH